MWTDDYVGLPWQDLGRDRAGVDCYGLARLPLLELDGIDLPSFAGDYVSALERADIAALIEGRRLGLVRPVADGDQRPRDLILLRDGALATHVGLFVRAGSMLHIRRGQDSAIEPYGGLLWGRRVVGFYRAGEGAPVQRTI